MVPLLSDGVVRLDSFRADDADAQVAGEDEELARRFGWWPKRSTREHALRAFAEWDTSWKEGGSRRAFAVRDVARNALVGSCELRIKEEKIGHCSYATFASERGKGYAARAMRLLSRWAFDEVKLERLELQIEPDNLASIRVALAAGFVEEGLMRKQGVIGGERRDMLLFSRLPSDG